MITFESVTKKYPNNHTAIDNVSFSISPGEFVFILGPSGSGKTTLLRLILREIKPSSGKIIVANHDLSLLPDKEIPHLRRQIGAAFQDFKLIKDKTAFENISLAIEILGKSESEIIDSTLSLLAKVGLKGKEHFFPSQLSGGETQRVAIARALALNPVLIFADEPTGNLDDQTADQIIQLLKQINDAGTTVIMSTHDHNLASKHAQRHIHLNLGKLIKDTKPKIASVAQKPRQQKKTSTSNKIKSKPKTSSKSSNQKENPNNPDPSSPNTPDQTK